MRKALLFIALPLLAAAGPAASQAPKPAPQEERPAAAPEAAPGPRLNLKLDDAGRYTRETPREGGSYEALPSLGDGARPLPTIPSSTSTRPFPKDSERGER
jgi:hypothetical protein